MKETEVEVINRAGIHARPASAISKTAQRFKSHIELKTDSVCVNAKSIMGVITLGATYKSRLILSCDGPDESEALAEIKKLFLNRFEVEE